MRILALETDLGALLKRFVVDTEAVLLVTSRHWLAFLIPFLLSTLAMALIAVLLPFVFAFHIAAGLAAMLVWFVTYCLLVANAVIRWKFNVLVVTSEQIIWVTQRSFFYNAITPTTIENVASARVETQFVGFFNVGTVRLSLKERVAASTREMTLTTMPRPGEISSVIENAIVLARQRLHPEEPIPKQREEFQRIREEAALGPDSAE